MIPILNNIIAFDTETTGTIPYGNPKSLGFFPSRPFLYTFTNTEGESIGFRFKVNPFTRQVLRNSNPEGYRTIKSILENPKITKVGHNIGFDVLMSKLFGINLYGDFHDTLTIAHIATGGSELTYALKPFSKKVFDFDDLDEKDLQKSAIEGRRKGKKLGWCIAEKNTHGKDPIKADYWLADESLCMKYGTSDTERTMLIYLGFIDKIRNNPGMLKTYQREKKLFPITWKMEEVGTRTFPDVLKKLEPYYNDYMNKHRKIADTLGGKDLNFNSPKQLSNIFYTVRKYQPIRFTKTKAPSTDADSLVYFKERYKDKLASAIIEYNAANRMLTNFVHPYERFRVFEKGCWVIHPNFKQVGPKTGRYACGDPNLQQTASDDSGKKKALIELRPRECFGPRDGYIWYLPDYSQIEVWVLSFISKELTLMNMLLAGEDFHEGISKLVWGDDPEFKEKITYYRKRSKNINFCKFYGGGITRVAELLGSSKDEAAKFVEEYDRKNPAIKRFMDRISTRIIRDGYIVNPFGRHYYLPPQAAYRATNYIVQGTAADILKEAMISISNNVCKKYSGVEMLLTLHDELVIEVPLKLHSKSLMRKIVSCMQEQSHVIGCPIPLPVGMKIAKKYWSKPTDVSFIKDEWKEKYICKKNIMKSSKVSLSMA